MRGISLNWFSTHFNAHEGYGRYGLHFIRALVSLGVDVYPGLIDEVSLPGLVQYLRKNTVDYSGINIQLGSGHRLKPMPGRVWGYSMYEDSSIPDGWAAAINQICERLLVPCEHNAEVFKRNGVKVPIHVVHGGTSPEEFPVLPVIPRSGPYTFVALADRGSRKGIEIVWAAFYQAFSDVQDVRLICKAREDWMPGLSFGDRRISRWCEDLDSMSDVFSVADCVVYPAFGEGWGMWPREAAMMGLPVIATNWSGLSVGIEHWAYPINKYVLQRSDMPTRDGQWAVPDVSEVARLMRYCYENREQARQFGIEAARWLRENQTWTHSAQQLIELVEKYR